MGKYKNMLIRQFVNATGYNANNYDSEEFKNEFYKWIIERQKLGEIYFELLNEKMKLDSSSVEVDKSLYDSIAMNSECGILTPYISEISSNNAFLKGHFVIDGVKPIYDDGTIKKELEYKTYFTQNPQSYKEIKYWNRLHFYNYLIAVGIYGKMSDKDFGNKQHMLQMLSIKMCDNYDYWFTAFGDDYFAAINSRNIKSKKLMR